MLLYNSRRLLFSDSTGKESVESSFLIASKKKRILSLAVFRYFTREMVDSMTPAKHNRIRTGDRSVAMKKPIREESIISGKILSARAR